MTAAARKKAPPAKLRPAKTGTPVLRLVSSGDREATGKLFTAKISQLVAVEETMREAQSEGERKRAVLLDEIQDMIDRDHELIANLMAHSDALEATVEATVAVGAALESAATRRDFSIEKVDPMTTAARNAGETLADLRRHRAQFQTEGAAPAAKDEPGQDETNFEPARPAPADAVRAEAEAIAPAPESASARPSSDEIGKRVERAVADELTDLLQRAESTPLIGDDEKADDPPSIEQAEPSIDDKLIHVRPLLRSGTFGAWEPMEGHVADYISAGWQIRGGGYDIMPGLAFAGGSRPYGAPKGAPVYERPRPAPTFHEEPLPPIRNGSNGRARARTGARGLPAWLRNLFAWCRTPADA